MLNFRFCGIFCFWRFLPIFWHNLMGVTLWHYLHHFFTLKTFRFGLYGRGTLDIVYGNGRRYCMTIWTGFVSNLSLFFTRYRKTKIFFVNMFWADCCTFCKLLNKNKAYKFSHQLLGICRWGYEENMDFPLILMTPKMAFYLLRSRFCQRFCSIFAHFLVFFDHVNTILSWIRVG